MDIKAKDLSKVVYNSIERTYISSKVSVVRWKPEVGSPNYFVSGSYDEDENYISLWFYPHNWDWSNLEENGLSEFKGDKIPCVTQELNVNGDVTGLKFIDNDKFIFSSNGGDFALVKISDVANSKKSKLEILKNWMNQYETSDEKPSYNSFEVGSTFTCALGKNGHLYFFSPDFESTFGTIDHINDEASCLGILSANEVLVGNLRGQLSLWDLREGMFEPSASFPYNNEQSIGITCITPFPRQRHMVVSGGVDGAVVTWDLRSSTQPLTVYKAHDRPITCLQFHEDWPANMFTASLGGEVWHWNNFGKLLTGETLDPRLSMMPSEMMDAMKTQSYADPQIHALIGNKNIPTNSLDVIKEQLVCSTDNDALVFVKPLKIC